MGRQAGASPRQIAADPRAVRDPDPTAAPKGAAVALANVK
jgi:hypothetical protein